MDHLPKKNIANLILIKKSISDLVINVWTQTYQLIPRWLGVNEFLVGVEKELTESSTCHDDHTAHKVAINEHHSRLSNLKITVACQELSYIFRMFFVHLDGYTIRSMGLTPLNIFRMFFVHVYCMLPSVHPSLVSQRELKNVFIWARK